VTIQDLGSLGELIAAVATVATLAYLAIQIRQNTRSVRASSRLEIAAGWRAHNRQMLDPAVNRAYLRGLHAYPEMPYDERNIFGNLMGDHAVFFQGAFALHEEGQLDRLTYEDYLTWFACQVATPGGSAFGKRCRPSSSKALRLPWHSALQSIRGTVVEVNLGASPTTGGLCHAAERPVRWAACNLGDVDV
jgi:hypothetical protein